MTCHEPPHDGDDPSANTASISSTTSSNESSDRQLLQPPTKIWAFIVGINRDWQDERDQIGDIALHQSLIQYGGIPTHQIVLVKDDDATMANIEKEFHNLLNKTSEGDTLLFYYGGCGEAECFHTHDGVWSHRDLLESMETHFCGDAAILLLDCSYSGNFVKALQEYPSKQKSYLCLCSTQTDSDAGLELTLTKCWIQALEGTSRHLPGMTQKANQHPITIEQVVGFMADKIARFKGDLMTAYIHGDIHPAESVFFHGRGKGSFVSTKHRTAELIGWMRSLRLRETLFASWKGLEVCFVGDTVYAKWQGGRPTATSPYILPLWFRGTITSVKQGGTLQVKLYDPHLDFSWNMSVHEKELLDEWFFNCSVSESSTSGYASSNGSGSGRGEQEKRAYSKSPEEMVQSILEPILMSR